MMREHSNTMVEYIEVFEKRDEKLTVNDLISYSGIDYSGFDISSVDALSSEC